ncbi:MAG: PAS domain S-box protein [Chloroflexi bacterium]|nr:PAS domain S-box protein [Chloroflexota bacterium]
MPKLPYSPLFKHRPRGRHLLALAVVGIYVLAWLSARAHNFVLPQSLLLVPIFTFAILYGLWGGIVSGVLFWPLHIFLLAPATNISSRWAALLDGWTVYAIFLSIAVFVGYMKELIDRLQHENEEHRRTQQALEKQIHQNQLMLNTMLDGYVLTDTEGRILHVNPAYCAMTGYSAEELLQMNIYEIGVQLSAEEITERIQEIITQGGARFETKHLHKDGRILDFDLSIALMQTEEEPLLAAFIRDITERKQAQQKLQEYAEQLEEMVEERTLALQEVQERLLQQERLATLGRLASGVSHELRNPLAVIANAVYYLKLVQTNAPPTIIEYLNLIDSEIKAATHIIAELQDFAKTPLAQRKAVILTEAVAEALQRRPIPPHIQTHIQIPADLRPVLVDPEHLARLLDELIKNAYDAMEQGGELRISATLEEEEEQQFIRLDIADTGAGLTPEAQKHAFEPLFSTKARGIGLGLTLCQALVAANSGRIALRPGPKQGAIASLWFPAVLLDMTVSLESGENK